MQCKHFAGHLCLCRWGFRSHTFSSTSRPRQHAPALHRTRKTQSVQVIAERKLAERTLEGIKAHLTSLKTQTAEHRSQVLSKPGLAGIIFMQGAELSVRNGDVMHLFRQHSDFAYLTGIMEPGYACLIDTATGHFTILAPTVDPQLMTFMGVPPSLDTLAQQYGADDCRYLEQLPDLIGKNHASDIISLNRDKAKLEQLFSSSPVAAHEKNALEQALVASRAIKTEADMQCLQYASDVSTQAHLAMWRACKEGMREYELEAEFVRTTLGAGLRHLGYPCIVAAGANASTLHYESNLAVIGPDELVLVDAGAEFRCFSADISRTFPAAGTFTAAQRDLYSAVLQVQEHAISLCQSGKGWKQEVVAPSKKLYCQLLLDLGLVRGSIQALLENNIDRVFMPHALGHFLGMDVHDVSPYGPVPEQLQSGHVVTVEPGLYFAEHILHLAKESKQEEFLNHDGIARFRPFGGIRIEDNVVMKQNGVLNLTEMSGMFKSISDIETTCRCGL